MRNNNVIIAVWNSPFGAVICEILDTRLNAAKNGFLYKISTIDGIYEIPTTEIIG